MEAPTLADAAIRESLRAPNKAMVPRRIGIQIANSRRFVLDDEASSFLSDLAHASYVTPKPTKESNDKAIAALEQTRQLARLPHAFTWIEYNPRAFKRRTLEANTEGVSHVIADRQSDGVHAKDNPVDLDEVVPRIGWLLRQEHETSFLMTLVCDANPGAAYMPFGFAWTTDDLVPPHKRITSPSGASDSQVATGVPHYNAPQVVITDGGWPHKRAAELLTEFVGELRFAWAFLAAVNDIPIGVKHVTPAKGFIAAGRYRKFVEHTVISIKIPKGRDPSKVAKAIVKLSRKRAHMVRGHWRRNWRSEGDKIWVKEHQRGDASLGFVSHDYSVQHKVETQG